MAKRYLGGGISFEQKDVYQEFSEDEGGGSTSLAGLTDVDITDPTDGQTLIYNAESGKWENGESAGGGGFKLFEVTFMAVDYPYIFTAPCLAISPEGVTDLGIGGEIEPGQGKTFKLVSFSDAVQISGSNFQVDFTYMPVCTGGVEMLPEGFMVTGNGTVTCKGVAPGN